MHPYSPLTSLVARLFYGAWLMFAGLEIQPLTAGTISSSPFHIRVWQAENGLPQNKVTTLAQTGDGYLWVGNL